MKRPDIARLIWCAIAALALTAFPARSQEAQTVPRPAEMDLEQYKSALDGLSAAVEAGAKSSSAAHSLREALPKAWRVRIERERFDVRLDWVAKTLEQMEKNPGASAVFKKQILERLKLMREEADLLERTTAPPDSATAKPALERILAQREFAGVTERSWMDRMRDKFWAWVSRMYDRIFGHRTHGVAGRKILVWVLIGGSFALFVWWARNLLQLGSREDAFRFRGEQPTDKTWSEWAQDALRAARAGDYRKAVHSAYWAGVFRLADLGAWELDRSRTPREYLRLLREPRAPVDPNPTEREQRAEALAKLTRNLEMTWYGYESATEVEFRDAVTQLEALGCRFPSNLATAKS